MTQTVYIDILVCGRWE